MVQLCERSVDDSIAANHKAAEAFLALLNRVAYATAASTPQQVQHLASRGFRDWGIQACTICDKISNSSDGAQLTLALLAFLRSPKTALLLPNDALILWKAAVQELNTLGAQSSQSYVLYGLMSLSMYTALVACLAVVLQNQWQSVLLN